MSKIRAHIMPTSPFCQKHIGRTIMTSIFVPPIVAITVKKKTPTSLGQIQKEPGKHQGL
jgi:hypothetical protein